jgi:hypothetical protein
MTALVVSALFYLHLAGQSIDPYLTWPVYGFWFAVGLWSLIKRGRIGGPALLALAAMMIAIAVGGIDPLFGARRLATVLGYMAAYSFLNIHPLNFNPALAQSAIIMSALVILGIYMGNVNVVAAFIYLAAPAALAWTGWQRWLTLAVSAAALVATGCRGGWLAAGVATLVYLRYWRLLPVAGVAGAMLYWLRPLTVGDRLYVWVAALRDLSPLGRGIGAGIFPSLYGGNFYHAHCLPLTVAVETGIPGLAALGWGLWRLLPRLLRGWQGATLAGLLAWSLVDEAVWFWAPGMIAMYLLAEVMS